MCAYFVLNSLTGIKKWQRMAVCQNPLEMADSEFLFLSLIVIGNKSCCFEYHLLTKHQSPEWHSVSSLFGEGGKEVPRNWNSK